MEPTALPSPPPEPVPAPVTAPPPSSPAALKKLLLTLLVLVLVVGAAAAGYFGHDHFKTTPSTPAVTMNEVSLPKDAIVTAECVAGRGKQYILASDIPDGPIYDVVNGKVVAVEYLVGLSELIAKPNNFSGLALHKGAYDHLALMPVDPHAGMTEQHFHAISYLISADEAKAITCTTTGAASSGDTMMHH